MRRGPGPSRGTPGQRFSSARVQQATVFLGARLSTLGARSSRSPTKSRSVLPWPGDCGCSPREPMSPADLAWRASRAWRWSSDTPTPQHSRSGSSDSPGPTGWGHASACWSGRSGRRRPSCATGRSVRGCPGCQPRHCGADGWHTSPGRQRPPTGSGEQPVAGRAERRTGWRSGELGRATTATGH